MMTRHHHPIILIHPCRMHRLARPYRRPPRRPGVRGAGTSPPGVGVVVTASSSFVRSSLLRAGCLAVNVCSSSHPAACEGERSMPTWAVGVFWKEL